jgi:ATP-binding cassette subfamily F protein 1
MSHINISYDKYTYTTDTIGINNFDLSVPGKELLVNSKLSMCPGSKYGLIGKNGSGKSSLLKKLIELRGDTNTQGYKISTLYVEQEIELDSRTPVEFVLDSNYKQKFWESELEKINAFIESDEYEELEVDECECLLNKAEELTQFIKLWNPDLERVRVIKILKGLGFTESDLLKESNLFSGGWQMRISLARALYLEPDLLLLDEPTNHLDLEAIIWLSDYLNDWKHTAIIVSHNIGFLNDVCDYILNIENKKLVSYKGNYHSFKTGFEAKIKEAEKEWEKYDKKLKDMKKKGAEKSKITDFIKANEVKRPEKPNSVNLEFQDQQMMKSRVISLSDVSFGYDESKPILSNVSVGIDMGSKVVLVGPNGSGKSTLIKLMVGEIEPTSGEVFINGQCRIGYYNQHFENQLPLDDTPIEYLRSIIPPDFVKNGAIDQSVRGYLGQVKLEATAHNKKISELSGGQKARVAIVKLIFQQPHCLILDEPTNHLDIETVESLIEALVNFEGGILVITHEPDLIEKIDARLWVMNPETKNINTKIDSYEEYCKFILSNQ